MQKHHFSFVATLILLANWPTPVPAAQWPLAPQNHEHEIIRDYGQHYNPPDDPIGHSIHKALDFNVSVGTGVLSAAEGVLVFIPTDTDAPTPYEQVRVFATDNDHAWEYRHISYEPNVSPPEGGDPRPWRRDDPVAPSVKIGQVQTKTGIPAHLYFAYVKRDVAYSDPYESWKRDSEVENPLAFLSPNADGTAPTVENVYFDSINLGTGQSNGRYQEVDGDMPVIHGPVDIIVQAYDRFNEYPSKIGVHSIGFEVTGPTSFIGEQHLQFSGNSIDPALSYDVVYSDAPTSDKFKYVVTNNNGDGITDNSPSDPNREFDKILTGMSQGRSRRSYKGRPSMRRPSGRFHSTTADLRTQRRARQRPRATTMLCFRTAFIR